MRYANTAATSPASSTEISTPSAVPKPPRALPSVSGNEMRIAASKYWYTLSRASEGMEKIAYVYAPMSINPAWPSENRPVKPLSRFMDTAARA